MNPLRVFRRSPESAESRIKELETKLDNVLKLVRDGAQTSLENQLQDSVDQKRFLDDAESSVKLLLQGYWKSLKYLGEQRDDLSQAKRDRFELERRLSRLREDKNTLETKLLDKIERIQTEHFEETSSLEKRIQALEHQNERLELNNANLQIEAQELGARYRNELFQKQKTHDAVIKELEDDHRFEKDQMKREYTTRVSELQKRHALNQANLEKGFESERSRLENEIGTQANRMKKDIESLNGALLARDRFTPIADHDLKSRFLDLAHDIDDLSRVEWKFNKTEWTADLLGRLSGNQRKLKKQILQDSLWIILYTTIFSSPFRIFGDEGRALETQWSDAFGRDRSGLSSQPPIAGLLLILIDIQGDGELYVWPKPSLEVERWRYEAVKNCQEALTQQSSEWDPRAKLKRAFQDSQENVRKHLADMIGKVTPLEEDTTQNLDGISQKAAKMWLEMGSQRCRILIVIPCSIAPQHVRVEQALEGSLELVKDAGLQRFGNSKGQHLEKKEIIGGCEGSTIRVSL